MITGKMPIWRSNSPDTMQHLQPLLENIGLNHHESSLYLYLLEMGEQPASGAARATKLPRSTVRNALDKLCERGIVHKIYKRNTQYYMCKEPSALVQYLEHSIQDTQHHLDKIQEALPVFSGLFSKNVIVPKVRVFEGAEQVKEAFNSTLYAEDVKEIVVLTSYEWLPNTLLRKNDDEFYIPMRVKKGIPLRTLMGANPWQEKHIRSQPDELRERRFLPKKYKFPGTYYVYGNNVLYFSASGEEYIAIIVESALMADTMRSLFEFMWEQCA